MTRTRGRARTGAPWSAVLSRAVLAQLLVLAVLLAVGLTEVHRAEQDLAADAGAGQSVVVAPRPAQRVSPPVGLSIPALRLSTRLGGVRTALNGTLQVPSDYQQAAWWSQGPAPGEKAPAVIVGHVDSRSGPAVFSGLDRLEPGDSVVVRRADGSTARFLVQLVKSYPKRAFPTKAVYAGTAGKAELRLITCGGSFDAARGHYRNNIVVFASLVVPPAPR